jgi:hypothetical protein
MARNDFFGAEKLQLRIFFQAVTFGKLFAAVLQDERLHFRFSAMCPAHTSHTLVHGSTVFNLGAFGVGCTDSGDSRLRGGKQWSAEENSWR